MGVDRSPPCSRVDYRDLRILSVIAVSFVARALSTIRSQIFCYAAISSAGVVTVLPVYLIREYHI